jgi:alkanesulfonate monooxygenase SsuD/methylene tetrahydromethanopterin reductase-like flavin-dependent oxidoreductase (luciferase family)
MTNDEALTIFEESLRKLKIQYDLFFLGIRKLPPSEDRRRLENLVQDLGRSRLRENAARFRYNALLARFNQFKELWNRQMREREEGPLDFRRRAAAMAEAETPPPPPPDPTPPSNVTGRGGESYVRVSEGSEADAARILFEQISEAQEKLGKSGLSLQQVEKLVASQMEMMRSRHSVQDVGFRVQIVDGKVKLKAKPLTKGS